MTTKRGYIRITLVSIEPKRLVEIAEAIEKLLQAEAGASVEVNMMPEQVSTLPRGLQPLMG